MRDYEIIIIGAGVSGAAIARELSKYKVKCCVLEKEEDVCCGTSKANSAIIHAGYDASNGSMMARMNVEGNAMMDELAKELDIPFKRIGSLVLCFCKEDMEGLQKLYDNGVANGVPDLQILSGEEVLKMEPNVSDEVYAALYAPTAGIVCPFRLNIALAENAYENGVEFKFDTTVEAIEKAESGFVIKTNQGDYRADYVINAAGVYADEIHNMVSEKKIHIIPRRGEYLLLDKAAGSHVGKTVFSLPSKWGKGVLVTPTVHGNLLVGPTAADLDDKERIDTSAEGLNEVMTKAGISVKNLPLRQVITSFAGLRAHEEHHEFILREAEDVPGFIDCAGIESPGLSSCPAIGKYIASLMKEKMSLEPKNNFVSNRKGILNPANLSMEERNKLIQKNPAYGNVICRCEMITEGEIVDAVNRPLGAKSLDGVKRRTRAGMGRCQGGFCSPRVMEIIARERRIDIADVTKSGGKSKFIVGVNKDSF